MRFTAYVAIIVLLSLGAIIKYNVPVVERRIKCAMEQY